MVIRSPPPHDPSSWRCLPSLKCHSGVQTIHPRSQRCHPPRPPDNPTPLSPLPNATPRRSIKKKRDQDDEKCVDRGGKGRVMVCFLRGNQVIARNHTDGLYYPGKVLKCPNVRRAIVQFTFGQQEVLTRFILPIKGAIPCPLLFVGDYALVKVMNLDEAAGCYVPCIVQFIPLRRRAKFQFHTVMLYNGRKVTARRSHLFKISKERFELTARYIAEVKGEDRREVEDKVYIHQKRDRSSSTSSSETVIPSAKKYSGSGLTSPPMRPRSPTPGVGMSRPDTRQEETETVEEEAPVVTPRILHLRRTLPELQTAEEVLARFSDDGWYYRGTIQQNFGDMSYSVMDATGYTERIWREDIISDYDDNTSSLKEDDRVIAQYPYHSGSYAPGNVLSVDDILQTAKIQFYDGHEGSIPRAEVYQLRREKYRHDVLHIQQCQRAMVGLSVVGRDDNTGEYFPGQIMEAIENGQNYIIRWTNGSQAKQMPVHIFSAMTRRYRLLIGDRVLAIADPEQFMFLPGQIVGAQDRGLVVRFCDGQVRDDVDTRSCFWVTQGYFEEASYFWKINQPDFGKRQMYQA